MIQMNVNDETSLKTAVRHILFFDGGFKEKS